MRAGKTWAAVMDIVVWLRSLGLGQYEAAFRQNDIDETVLPNLTAEDLKELGIASLGHRRKLLDAIAALRTNASSKVPSADAGTKSSALSAPPEDRAERRQVTVMFSDLVGSTALSARLDPEDLREVISAYQRCVAETVQRFGGFVAKYMGDGVLIYFGYPQAHEDDAERAVRAGLELVAAVGALKTHAPLPTRVGIATGLVVVGDLIGSGASQEQAIVGETPNLAARLQGVAEPNSVVIAESTRKLVGNLFELENLGPKGLKGIASPVRAWAALRPASVDSRFEALHASGLTELVGREEELELLLRRWSRAESGEGQVVLLAGEPGIGKSRLTAALLERLAGEPHTGLRYFCSPQHSDSAFYPIIGQMERSAGFAYDDTPRVRLDKLDAALAHTSTSKQDVALLGEMMSLPNGERYPAVEMNSQQRRNRTLDALIEQIEALTRQNPVLMIFEDAHWSDPTSLEVFGRVVDRIATLRVLLIVTFRPEFEPPWVGQPHVTVLTLNRLTRREIDAMIDRVVGNKPIPMGIRQDIVERTDGIPLFAEEMTKAVLEAESEGEARRSATVAPIPARAVPASLQASLMARLDRLGSAKEVAQIGAAIGREFSHALLAAVVSNPEPELASALDRLIATGLLLRQGAPPHASYLFKHALVQDAAYGTLLRQPRRALHARIADTLVSIFPDQASVAPELIAKHLEGAERPVEAIERWREAGDRAMRRSATIEALTHFGRALELVIALPETRSRSERELAILLRLGLASQVAKGPASPQTAEYYRRAVELSRALAEPRQEFMAAWGLWLHFNVQGLSKKALQHADRLLDLARDLHDADLELEGHHAHIPVFWMMGDLEALRGATLEVMHRYDPSKHSESAHTYVGHDSLVCARSFHSIALWGLGFPTQAYEAARRAIDDARHVDHPFTLAHGLGQAAITFQLQRDRDACLDAAEEAIAVAERNGFPWPLAFGRFCQGWVRCTDGDTDTGIAAMLDAAKHPSMANRRSYMLGIIASVQIEGGHLDDAVSSLEGALTTSRTFGIAFYDAEIFRLQGRLQAATNGKTSEENYKLALDVARRQGARLFEVRSATDLARLWRDQGKVQQARELLAPVYGWFTEGFDTRDLKDAKALLKELAS
jgi:class 3 adenylate cyclase/tetratricopeptide (TPR) repeat protein